MFIRPVRLGLADEDEAVARVGAASGGEQQEGRARTPTATMAMTGAPPRTERERWPDGHRSPTKRKVRAEGGALRPRSGLGQSRRHAELVVLRDEGLIG